MAAFASLLMGSAATAQRPLVETYGIGQGLMRPDVQALAQAASGTIWLLTAGRLTNFDGRSFTQPTHAGLPDVEIAQLAVDEEGGVWTVTRRPQPAVYRLSGSTWLKLASDPPGLHPELLMTLALSGSGGAAEVAIGTSAGLWLWRGQRWHQFEEAAGLPSTEVNGLSWRDGELAIGTEAGLCVLGRDLMIDCSLRSAEARLGDPIIALHRTPFPDAGSRLWILARDWLGVLDDGSHFEVKTSVPRMTSEGRQTLGSLLVDRAGGVYFGLWQLLFYLSPEARIASTLSEREGLVSNGVKTLLLDHESNVWVGSGRGLSKIESWRFRSYDEDSGLLEDEVTAIAEMRPGELVLGHNSGLTLFGEQRIEHLPFRQEPQGLPDANRVLDLLVEDDGTLVAAHRSGLLRLGRDGRLRQVLEEPIVTLAHDSAGKLWAASFGEIFVREGDDFHRVEHGLEGISALRWITADDAGELYVSSTAGLLVRNGGDWKLAQAPRDHTSNVYGVLAEPGGVVWVGTSSGLHRLTGDFQLERVRQGELHVERPLYFIFRGPQGDLWLGTDDGVFIWDGGLLRHLTVEQGLIGRETNRGAGFVDHRGNVWIGTQRGVSLYQRVYDRQPRAPPRVALEAISVGSRRVPPQQPLQLSSRENTLTFHARPIAFSKEKEVFYHYRLDGLDEDWQGPASAEVDTIRYTSVPSGSYHFRISAAWEGEEPGPEVKSGLLAIAQPLWRRPWFLLLTAVSLTLGLVGGHSLRTQRIRTRNLALVAANTRLQESIDERQRLIEELSSKNAELERFTYTVSHDLKSPLVTISGFLGHLRRDSQAEDRSRLEEDIDRIDGAVTRMRRIINELVELSRVGRLVNSPEPVALNELVEEVLSLCASSQQPHELEVVVDPDLPTVYGDRERLLEVYLNLIENAIKFMGNQSRPRIEIGVRWPADEPTSADSGEPVYFVRDNGIGVESRYQKRIFELFERLDPEIEGTGVGLALVRRIVELHHGQIWAESDGDGTGTTFCFTLRQPEPGD